jgi:tetratricopeptide (TPR) repeat protein
MNGRRLQILSAVIAATVGLCVAPRLGAADEAKQQPGPRPAPVLDDERPTLGQRAQPIRDWAAARLEAAQKAMNEERFDDARALLDALDARQSLNVNERAAGWRLLGALHASQENYEGAAAAFEKSIDSGGLAEETALETRYNLAQVYLMTGDYDAAIRHLEAWLAASPEPGPDAHYVLAMAYAHAGRRKEAIGYAEMAVEEMEKEHEGRLQLLAVLLYEEERYEEVLPLLQRLVVSFPKKTYWTQTVAVYSELERYEEALALQEAMYEQGLLSSSQEMILLAQLLLHNGIPFEAAKVLEDGLASGVVADSEQSWELLASSYLDAREYESAIRPLSRAAALAETGEAWVRLGQVELSRRNPEAARKAFDAALAKGGLDDPGRVWLLVGMVEASDERYEAAGQAFRKAAAYPAVADAAGQWLAHIDHEVALLEAEASLERDASEGAEQVN